MNKIAYVLLCLLLTGCQSIDSKIADLPSVEFDPVISNKSEAYADGKVTFQLQSSGTDVWLVVKNGARDFIELSDINIAGSRCTYLGRGKQLLTPSSVTTLRVPTVGLLGLCYDNEDQINFINHPFKRLTSKPDEKANLPIMFSINYEFPGVENSKKLQDSQTLYLNFSS